MNQEQKTEFDMRLLDPLPTEKPDEVAPSVVEMERAEFDRFYAQITSR